MPTTVGSVPVGTQTVASGDTITVSYLRNNSLVIAGRLGEVMELQYFVDLILPMLAGGTGVTAGEAVEVLDTGTIQDLASGHKVGVAISTAAAAAYALVRVSI